MATTNFASLTDGQKINWSRETWKTARQQSFIMGLSGTGMNAPISRVTELTQTDKGAKAIVTLVPDLTNDGVMGDYTLEGNEAAATAAHQTINIDQIRNANKSAGKMAEQKTVVKFRETCRDLLGYWAADMIDQMAILTLSGIDYRFNTNGSLRAGFTHNGSVYSRNTGTSPVGQSIYDHACSADVTAPSSKRHFRWDASTYLTAPGVTGLVAADTITYRSLVELKAHAKDRRLRSIKGGDGMEMYHVILHPKVMAKLKLDSDFLANIRNAGVRGPSNPLFSGSIVTVDGLVLHENTRAFTTLGATAGTVTNAGWPGYKWGANADVDGSRVLMLGAQALAFADIGIPEWDERNHFDYGNQPGIAIQKILGFKKPVFTSPIDGTSEDYGVVCMDVAI